MILDIVESSEGERVESFSRTLGERPEVLGFMGEGACPEGLTGVTAGQL